MKVIEHLERAKNPLFSYEIVPPPRGRSVQEIIDIVKILEPLRPPWIDVTSHCASAIYHENSDGTIERRIYKKRPGTIGICGIIQNRFKIDTVAHILCQGFTREETEDALIELNFLGIHNILAIKGDGVNFPKPVQKNKTVNNFASDLVEQISNINKGQYLHEIERARPLDFCIGVAGYPEKHFEAPNIKSDISSLKEKVDKGADYVATQMFFSNEKYFNFVDMAGEEGVTLPIIPGLKIIKSTKQLKALSRTFHIDFPDELVDELNENPMHSREIGINWAIRQVEGLLSRGVPNVHFYIMNDADLVAEVVKRFI